MRLKQLKLAGFKSFVDPTIVAFPSPLVAVVGPNGCGKSNIIDAVRWVMGESSAKHLRGEQIADVIFNGSANRKPVGLAQVELIFDNTEGKLLGEYAAYSEISVKRRMTREGQSTYLLNGTKCRRRDIIDLILGTGVGPRSYAIIEQGTVSRLIEAKPEELRVYLEEAAGISKYKERRKETENRIKHTRENLERLTDIRDELQKQLDHLQRQAATAERYKNFKQEVNALEKQLKGLKWHKLNKQYEAGREILQQGEVSLEEQVAKLREAEAKTEEVRLMHQEVTEKTQNAQKVFYEQTTAVAKLEQQITLAKQRCEELTEEMTLVDKQLVEAADLARSDSAELESLEHQLENSEPNLIEAQEQYEQHKGSQTEAETALKQWQTDWQQCLNDAHERSKQCEIENTKAQHLEKHLNELQIRESKLTTAKSELAFDEFEEKTKTLAETSEMFEASVAEQEQQGEALQAEIMQIRTQQQMTQDKLSDIRANVQSLSGKLASQEALQAAALDQENNELKAWLAQSGLSDADSLIKHIQVQSGWEKAVETVLGQNISALCIGKNKLSELDLNSLSTGQLNLFISNPSSSAIPNENQTLLAKVSSQFDLSTLLGRVLCVEEDIEAIAYQAQLEPGQSVVSRSGLWVSASTVYIKKYSNENESIVVRDKLIAEIKQQKEIQQAEAESLKETIEELNTAESAKQAEAKLQQESIEQARSEFATAKAELTAAKNSYAHIKQRAADIEQEITLCQTTYETEKGLLKKSRHIIETLIDQIAEDNERKELLHQQENELREQARHQQQYAQEANNRYLTLKAQVQGLKDQLAMRKTNVERATKQLGHLKSRIETMSKQHEQSSSSLPQQQAALEQALDNKVVKERDLQLFNGQLEQYTQELKLHEQNRSQTHNQISSIQTQLEKKRLDIQTYLVKKNAIEEDFDTADDIQLIVEQLPEEANEAETQESIERLNNKISRLGAINLAAIDEHKSCAERKNYMDRQNDDLCQALEILEAAIAKIDKETREKFRETFDFVNENLQQFFPRMFDGGQAYLELTGDDLLSTGIAIMARPPGKRNSTIHLLSGGEKALVAVALVFSLFKLNPAPFCMLDEVDAPLDDANVRRFTKLIKEMSDTVQFIFITHNKITMELAEHLMGVTMREPGVSRMVSVDIDEAATYLEPA